MPAEMDTDRMKAVRQLEDQVARTAMFVSVEDAELVIEQAEFVEAFGPFEDPTWYRDNADAVSQAEAQGLAYQQRRKLYAYGRGPVKWGNVYQAQVDIRCGGCGGMIRKNSLCTRSRLERNGRQVTMPTCMNCRPFAN